MDIWDIKLGTKLDLELVNSLGEKIGQTYVSQLIDVIDKENIIIAAPIHEARLMLITNGTRIRSILLHEKQGLLCFRGIIAGKEKKENIISFHVKIEGDFEKIQRRKYFRLDCNLNASYRPHPEEDAGQPKEKKPPAQAYKKTLTKNISGCGVCIVTEEEFPRNSLLEVVLWLNKDTTIKVVCKAIRSIRIEGIKEKKYELGLYFSEISQRDQDMVIKFIFDQQRLLLKNNIADKA